jgi:hypothetical protein
MAGTPRVLTITFKIHVNRDLKANIRFARIESAAESLVNGMLTLLPRVFPWADRVAVDRNWSYDWWSPNTETIQLPPTEDNTPDELTDPAADATAPPEDL